MQPIFSFLPGLSRTSLKWKLLILTLSGPLIIALVLALINIWDSESAAMETVLNRSRTVVDMAESIRTEFADKIQRGVIRPFSELSPDQVMDAVPIVVAMRMAQGSAQQGEFFVRTPKVAPRNPANTPDSVELQALEQLKSRNLREFTVTEPDR
ncbi:MAG: DUF3365 domain-containing protein, partial [Desulfovibrio sp.]